MERGNGVEAGRERALAGVRCLAQADRGGGGNADGVGGVVAAQRVFDGGWVVCDRLLTRFSLNLTLRLRTIPRSFCTDSHIDSLQRAGLCAGLGGGEIWLEHSLELRVW